MSVHTEQLHNHLRRYKDDSSPATRERLTLRLAALLGLFLDRHLDSCLGGQPDLVATVPSAARDAPWRIVQRLYRFQGATNPLYFDPNEQRFAVNQPVAGRRVLLIEDTFTKGRKTFAAVDVLLSAGAEVAGPVVVGRHFQPDTWEPSAELFRCLRRHRWTLDACAICGGVTCGGSDQTELFP
jgi:hypothetical protein